MTAGHEQRMIELETRLAFQEQALTELSDAMAEIRAASGQQALMLERALADLKQLRTLAVRRPGRRAAAAALLTGILRR